MYLIVVEHHFELSKVSQSFDSVTVNAGLADKKEPSRFLDLKLNTFNKERLTEVTFSLKQ